MAILDRARAPVLAHFLTPITAATATATAAAVGAQQHRSAYDTGQYSHEVGNER
jgi:hypothetical protein